MKTLNFKRKIEVLSIAIALFFILLLTIPSLFRNSKSAAPQQATTTETTQEENSQNTKVQAENPREVALKLVKSQLEVINWLELLDSVEESGEPIFEIDTENGDDYIIHVYELKDNHTATFGWYEVNVATETVKEIEL